MEFSQEDYLKLISEMDYIEYKLNHILDPMDLAQIKEINFLKERWEYLNDLLNQWRAIQRRKGFTVLKGGRP